MFHSTEADLSKSGSEATGSGNLTAGWASWAVTSLTSKFYRSKSTSSSLSTPPAPGNTGAAASSVNSSNVKSEHSSSRPPSKQASEDSDVWGRAGESADDDEVKSQASKGDWDSSGWDNDDDILNVQHTTSASNCDKDIKPSKSPDGDEGVGGGGGASEVAGRRSIRERTNSTNGWDEKEQDLLGSFGISEADLKPSNAPSSSASHTSSVPGGVASRKGGSSGPRKTPGVTKGPLKLGAKKLT